MFSGKEEIQNHLIIQYQNYHALLPVAPLYDDEGLQISDLYTHVVLHENNRNASDDVFSLEENKVTTYSDIFHRRNTGEPTKLILLKGPAGRGKSSFCAQMANVWASGMKKKARQDQVLFTDDETEMLKYDFVFLLALRFSNGIDSAFEMVKDQLFEEAPLYTENLEKCFRTGNCLLILDGLDEWTSQTGRPLPSLEKLYSCTRMITTRPWKLHVIPANMNIRVLEIGIMDENAVRTLATKIMAYYYKVSVSHQEKMVNNFMHALKKHNLDSMAEIPLILTYLICLWKDESGLEESKTVNYGGLLESLIKYINPKLPSRSTRTLPGSLSCRPYCCKYSKVLYKVAEFAFKSIVGYEQPILVFRKIDVANHFNDASELQFCLDSGLLSQSKAPGFRKKDNVIVQFFHKSIQEYLVALYIAMSPLEIMYKFQRKLTSVDKILEMSNILIFVSGLRPQYCNILSKTIAIITDESPEIKKYRSSLAGRFSFRKSRSLSSYRTIKDIQGLVLQCTKECSYNKRFVGTVRSTLQVSYGTIFPGGTWRVKPCLYDFVVKENSNDDVITLLQGNVDEVKSIYIDSPARKTVPQLSNQIQKTKSLQRLHLDPVSSGLIYDLKVNKLCNLRSLTLVLDNISQFPRSLSVLKHLKALSLCTSATHPVIEEFMVYFQSASALEEIDLEKVRCVTHSGIQRCNISLNIAANSCLKKLSVQELSVNEIALSPCVNLEEVWLSGWMSNPSSVVSFLPASMTLSTLILGNLFAFNCFQWKSDDIQVIARVLPKLKHLKHLYLLGISFGEHIPYISPCAIHLETISLEDISLQDNGWIKFMRSLLDIPQISVSCLVTTKEDAYPIQLLRQATQHFSNLNISMSQNRAIIRFEIHQGGIDLDNDERGECECLIHNPPC